MKVNISTDEDGISEVQEKPATVSIFSLSGSWEADILFTMGKEG